MDYSSSPPTGSSCPQAEAASGAVLAACSSSTKSCSEEGGGVSRVHKPQGSVLWSATALGTQGLWVA